MRGEVVVQEELTAHEEEGEVVHGPDDEEEAGGVPEAVAHGCGEWSVCGEVTCEGKLRTVRNGLDASPPGQNIRTEDPDEDRRADHTRPPSNQVADEVNLLLSVVLRPERDAGDEERPVERSARVRVRRDEARVVLQHQDLQLAKLFEKVHLLGLLVPELFFRLQLAVYTSST